MLRRDIFSYPPWVGRRKYKIPHLTTDHPHGFWEKQKLDKNKSQKKKTGREVIKQNTRTLNQVGHQFRTIRS